MFGMFFSLWQYRHFVLSSIRTDLKARFARSKLGGLWMIIHPLAQVTIYALIFSNVLGARLTGTGNKYAYAVYLMIGMLAWSLFDEIINRCLRLFIEQGNLMKKMNFPRVTLPSIVIGSCLLNNFFLFVAILVIIALLGYPIALGLVWFVPLSLVVCAFAMGLGLILGVLNVFFRDLGQVIPIILQIWFWFTPIVYSAENLPASFQRCIAFNPMNRVIRAYRAVLMDNTLPQLSDVLPIIGVSLVLLLLGLFLFKRASAEMVDVL